MDNASSKHQFYIWAGVVFLVLPVLAFAPSYWLQLPAGTVIGTPGLHLHALLFASWPLLFLLQSFFAARGRIKRHRAWGIAGVVLATAMVFSGVDSILREMQYGISAGHESAVQFALGPMIWILLFAGFFSAALLNISRPETHKRLMLLATVAIMPPTFAHFLFSIIVGDGPGLRPGLAGPAPIEALAVFGLLADLLLIGPFVYDWRRRGRPHKVYLVGGSILIVAHIAVLPLSTTRLWHAIALGMIG